ncbi:hypothetical protein OG976_24465 [Mycobacterium sp. NBC_00419]|uniref:hypothetical protein n=1 Tax=Mycobacterium sp. NBC_00419 TaxID=2975989 RepID=UPI002E251230
MSRSSMAAVAAQSPRPELFGIASCKVGTEFHDFEIGWEEAERDIAWAQAALQTAGLGSEDVALVTLPNWEGPWFNPVLTALHTFNVIRALAENYAWDARRAGHMVRSLKPRAIVGLGAETISGLTGQGDDVGELLGGIEFVWARHDALGPLAEAGLAALPLVPLGPALAIGVPGVGAVVNTDEWDVQAVDGQFVVSTAGDRRARFTNVETGIRGRVGPRVELGTVVEFDL